jgi:hypothetical protein
MDEQEVLNCLRTMDDIRQQQALLMLRALAQDFPRDSACAKLPPRLSLVAPSIVPAALVCDGLRERLKNG